MQIHEQLEKDLDKNVNTLNAERDDFVRRNYDRWKEGLDALQMLRQISIEAGVEFQREFLKHKAYRADPHLGILMRLHARANRIAGEIIVLLMNGYADGALSRWRTLHEIAITALILGKHGVEASKDYIRYGMVQAVDGMEAYQKTANDMNRTPYSDVDLRIAKMHRDEIIQDGIKTDQAFNSQNGWARRFVGSGKFEKLQADVGLDKWRHDYKWASQDIHANYRDMRALLAMSEAKEEILVCGPSNSGMVEPGHMTAIALSQVTAAFLNAYISDPESRIDYKKNLPWLMLLEKFTDFVGKSFLECDQKTRKT